VRKGREKLNNRKRKRIGPGEKKEVGSARERAGMRMGMGMEMGMGTGTEGGKITREPS
jgi:hypothetical protein